MPRSLAVRRADENTASLSSVEFSGQDSIKALLNESSIFGGKEGAQGFVAGVRQR